MARAGESVSATRSAGAPTGASLLRGLVREHARRMSVLAVASFLGAMIEATFLVLLTATLLAVAGGRERVDTLFGHSLSVPVALGLCAAAVIARFTLNLLAVVAAAALGAAVRARQRQRLAEAFLCASWQTQDEQAAGRLQELQTSFTARINLAVTAITQGVTAVLSLVAFLGAGLFVEPLATLAVLGVIAALGAILTPLRRRIRSRSAAATRADLAFAAAVAELGTLTLDMQTFGVRRAFIERINGLIASSTENQRRVQLLTGALSPIYTLFVYVAIIGAVAALSLVGSAGISSVGAVMLLMLRSMTFGQQLASVSATVTSALPSMEVLDTTLADLRARAADDGSQVPSAALPLVLESVSYAYREDRPALVDVSLRLDPGEALGVIGPSGAGKSSLAQLLLGLRRPDTGRATVSGVPLQEVDRQWWSRRVAFVAQHPLLFTGTVAENIRFFRPDISDEAVRAAAREANVLQDIMGLPHGFDTHLGERGSQLSGGQRQRLSIARALAGSPEVLIHDAPTAALDGHSEAMIRDALRRLHGRMAVVIIAHRMSTLDLCDQLLVLEAGRVTAYGTPEELRASNDFYRRALTLAGLQ